MDFAFKAVGRVDFSSSVFVARALVGVRTVDCLVLNPSSFSPLLRLWLGFLRYVVGERKTFSR